MKIRFWTLLAASLSLGACADYLAVDDAGHRTATPPKPAAAAPSAPVAVAEPAPPPAPPSPPDTCGAAPLQYLVGKPKSEIPVPVDPSHRRVYCTTCVVTQDIDKRRQNIVFDTDTGRVTAVKCG